MITCQSIAASVECQDESGFWTALPEYRVTSPDNTTTTCFIESKAGKHFRVKYHEVYKLPNSSYDACISTWVDGKEMECYTYERARAFGQYNHTTVEGVRTSSTERLPFTFAKLATTDDDDVATKDEQVVKNIGTIRVGFHRAVLGAQSDLPSHIDKKVAPHVLHERAKKATLDHSTTFGPAKTIAPLTSRGTTWIDDRNRPYLILEFKYRSGDLLEADGIKPPEPGARAASSDTVDDSGTARSKRKATSASRTPVDIDDSDDDRNASKKVKKEKKKPVTAGRVIDIDDDDEETEIQKLRRENEQLRQKVKVERTTPNAKKGQIIEID